MIFHQNESRDKKRLIELNDTNNNFDYCDNQPDKITNSISHEGRNPLNILSLIYQTSLKKAMKNIIISLILVILIGINITYLKQPIIYLAIALFILYNLYMNFRRKWYGEKNKTSEAQRRASDKWDKKNRQYKTIRSYRSSGIRYISEYSTLEDLEEFKKIINDRELQLKEAGLL